MLNSALFAIIEEAGTAVMILGEDVERGEFLASRLTRSEVQRSAAPDADHGRRHRLRTR